jgi:hypothetical protein
MRRLDGGSSAASDPDDSPRRSDPESRPDSSRDSLESTGHSPVDELPADAQDIEQLLASLSLLRLAMSAELSAAAGALEEQRPDVAADLVDGAHVELQQLRASVSSRRARELAPALVGGGPEEPLSAIGSRQDGDAAPVMSAVPHARRGVGLGHWQGRILAGALAIGLALMVLPHSGSGRAPTRPGAANAQPQAINVKLVSSEFTTLRETLESKTPAAASVLAAARNWHTAVARSLPVASTHAAAATQIVELLREERALLGTPAMSTPQLRETAIELTNAADSLFARLRALASSQVLAVLPDVLTALPIPSTTPAPAQSSEPPSIAVPTPEGTPTAPDSSTPASPAAPQPTFPAPSSPAPATNPGLPALPLPLPSLPALPALPALPNIIAHLGGLTGSQETTSSADQTSSDQSGTGSPSTSPSTSLQDALKASSFSS